MVINSNANMMYNPETIHKYVADEALKQYALLNMLPTHLADAHMRWRHSHTRFRILRRKTNKLSQHDIRAFIKYGLKSRWAGDHTSVGALIIYGNINEPYRRSTPHSKTCLVDKQ